MDEIIYLEPDEEITSVIDKLKALNPELKAVSLVIPKGAGIIQSVVNLKLLKKEGESLAKDLSIVTQDRIGRNLASQAGFTVYDSINASKPMIEPPRPQPNSEEVIELDLTGKKEEEDKAPSGIQVHRYDNSEKIEPKPAPKIEPIASAPKEPEVKQKPAIIKPISHEGFAGFGKAKPADPNSKKKKIILGVIGGLLIAGAVLFYIFCTKAIATLAVKSDILEAPIEVTVDNNINKPDEAKVAIPGELLETEQQGGKKFTATGKKEVGEKAKGTVTVSNSGGEQKISAGTEFKSSSGLYFKATSDYTIPSATFPPGSIEPSPGKSNVSVEASESGDKYNIGPSDFAIVGKSTLSGKSSNPMSGGISKQITIVSQNDLNDAKSQLTGDISATNLEELKKKAGKNKIYDSSVKNEVTASEADKKVGDEAESFEMKITVKSSVISFNEQDYREMVVKALEKTIPQDKTLTLSSQDEISITTAETDTKTGLLMLKGTVKTRTIPKMDETQVKDSIKGKNKSDAENILKQIKGVESAAVSFKPSWLIKKVPNRIKNIQIKFEYK